MSGEFYVYVLENPLKDGEPFYVGKGRGRRSQSHIAEARSGKNSHKCNTIRSILAEGLLPTIKMVDVDLSEDVAFDLEIAMILMLGRRDCGTGTLTNKTDGGEGSVGYKHSPESIEKIRLSQIGKTVSEETRQRIRENSRSAEIRQRPGYAERLSGENHCNFGKEAFNKGTKWTEDQLANHCSRQPGYVHPFQDVPCTEARREAIRAATTGVKKSTTEKMKKPKPKLTCPHCGMVGGTGNMQRWHFDNCKKKECP